MNEVVRFKTGVCRIFPDKTGDEKGNYEVLRRFPEMAKAEEYLADIREFMVIEDENDGKFIILSRHRKDYPNAQIIAGLTTYSKAQEFLENINKK